MTEYIIRETAFLAALFMFASASFVKSLTAYPGAVKQEIVQELVRCKDCKWWKELEDVEGMKFCTYVLGGSVVRNSFDYCSRGERRDNEDLR